MFKNKCFQTHTIRILFAWVKYEVITHNWRCCLARAIRRWYSLQMVKMKGVVSKPNNTNAIFILFVCKSNTIKIQLLQISLSLVRSHFFLFHSHSLSIVLFVILVCIYFIRMFVCVCSLCFTVITYCNPRHICFSASTFFDEWFHTICSSKNIFDRNFKRMNQMIRKSHESIDRLILIVLAPFVCRVSFFFIFFNHFFRFRSQLSIS